MKTDLETVERQFLERLHKLGRGTVQEIGEALGVTATAIRQRLMRLQSLGYIERQLVRVPRGRPHHTYGVTEKAVRLLGDNYSDLALILWREIQGINDPAVREHLRAKVRDALVARFGNLETIPQLDRRLQLLTSELTDRGFDVEIETGKELPIIRENNCPYSELAETDRGICELEQDVFQRVLGVPVRLTRCCQDDHSCCEFEVGRAS